LTVIDGVGVGIVVEIDVDGAHISGMAFQPQPSEQVIRSAAGSYGRSGA